MTNPYQLSVKIHGIGIALNLLGLVEILDFLGSKNLVAKHVGFALGMVGIIKFVIDKQSDDIYTIQKNSNIIFVLQNVFY